MQKRMVRFLIVAVALAGLSFPSQASVGLGGRFGTTGVGGEVAVQLVEDYLNLRVAGNVGWLDVDVDQDDVTYESEVDLQTWLAVLDWHVGGGSFKIVAGACYNGSEVTGVASPTGPIDVGDITFTPAQIGTLHAAAEYSTLGGYLGIGFGNLAASQDGRWTVSMDLGVMFFGEPDLSLESRGGTLSDSPLVQQELQRELDEFDEDYMTWLRYYPVLTVGVAVRF